MSVSGLEDAKHASIEFADMHFMRKGIAEPRLTKDQIQWDAVGTPIIGSSS